MNPLRPSRATARLLLVGASLAATVQAQEDASQQRHPWGRSVATLTDPGQEPRVRLARRPTARPLDLEYRFDQRLTLKAVDEANSVSRTSEYPLLGIHVQVSTDPLEGGNLRQRLALKEVAFANEATTTTPVRRDVEAQVEALRGLDLTWNMEPSGAVLGESVTLSGNLTNPALALVLLDEMAMDWALALPDEPVGVGARWHTRGHLPVHMVGPAFRADTTLSVEVKEIAGGEMRLEVGIHRVAAELGAAPGALPQAENYDCEGKGEVLIDLETGLVVGARMQREVDAHVPVGNSGHAWNLHLEIVTLVIRRSELPEHARTGAAPQEDEQD